MDVQSIYGRESDINKLMGMIFSPGVHNPSVVPIVGMGGVGKTTLVQHVYNDQAVCNHFELRGWVCVSDDFEVDKLTKRILQAITKEQCDLTELSVVQEKLVKVLSGKRFLLVLDDLWNQKPNLWDKLQAPLVYGLQGSTIIITTRNESVAEITQTMPFLGIGCLPFDDCWKIFLQYAFRGQVPNEKQGHLNVGKKIVRRCKGLPLASATLGGLLRCELSIDKWNAILRSDIWDLHKNGISDILPTLMLSYIHLPVNLKRCFAYCALLPKDFSFTKDQLVRFWIAQGFVHFHEDQQLEDTGMQYFDELLQRSLFQKDHQYSPEHEQGFVMHDLIHDLAVFVSGGECSMIKDEETWRASCKNQYLRHIAFVPYGYDTTEIFQLLCQDVFGVLRSLMLVRRTDLWAKNDVITEIPAELMKKLGSLRLLDMSYIRLKDLPDSIGRLKHLRYLDLRGTRIEVLPESVCLLYLMQAIDLSYARITKLPDSLRNLKKLRYVNLCHTGITVLPETIGELTNLRTLDLGYTSINKLPQSVGNLTHLAYLDLSGTEVTIFPEPICMLCNLRTLNLNNVRIYKLPYSIGNLQNLRHLSLNETRVGYLPESICNLHQLQMLNLSFSRIQELPESIGNMARLCHLDLSDTLLTKLPASICDIYSLQSLLLKSCSKLESLPDRMGNLTNLQHLDFNSQRVYMPSGIGRLIGLRTLPIFNVGSGVCAIEELMKLTELRGSLQISGLRYVMNPEQANMANLRMKTQIDRLTLKWESNVQSSDETASKAIQSVGSASEGEQSSKDPSGSTVYRIGRSRRDRPDPDRDRRGPIRPPDPIRNSMSGSEASDKIASKAEQLAVLDKLQPHPGLTELKVLGYEGGAFPRWVEDPSFPRLVRIVLEDCTNCCYLPALGQLPSLKQLTIARASSVEHIGPEFRFRNGARRVAFPSLEEMRVRDMTRLVKWDRTESGDFPRLAWLEVHGCPLLQGLPSSTYPLPMLKVLKLGECRSLTYLPLHNVPNLRTFELWECGHVGIAFGDLHCSSSSSSLALPESTTPKEMPFSLWLRGCPEAFFIPGGEYKLPPMLSYLDIDSGCSYLRNWFEQNRSSWLAQFPNASIWTRDDGSLTLWTFSQRAQEEQHD